MFLLIRLAPTPSSLVTKMRKGPGALVVVGASVTGTSVTGATDVTMLPSLEQAVTPNRPSSAIPNGRVKLFMISPSCAVLQP